MRRPYRSRMRRPHPRGIRIALPTRSAIAVARRRRRPRGWRRKLSAHDHRHPPHRRCIRLRGYDYATTGAYFVTICTRDRLCLFGEIADDAMRLSAAGEIAAACWCEIPTHFTCVELDAFVTMPNHVHGIINIVGATHASPLPPCKQQRCEPREVRKGPRTEVDDVVQAGGIEGAPDSGDHVEGEP